MGCARGLCISLAHSRGASSFRGEGGRRYLKKNHFFYSVYSLPWKCWSQANSKAGFPNPLRISLTHPRGPARFGLGGRVLAWQKDKLGGPHRTHSSHILRGVASRGLFALGRKGCRSVGRSALYLHAKWELGGGGRG